MLVGELRKMEMRKMAFYDSYVVVCECEWVGDIEKYDEHLSFECPLLPRRVGVERETGGKHGKKKRIRKEKTESGIFW